MKKKQGNQKRGCGGKKNSVQELLSIQYFTKYGLMTEHGEMVFFQIAPTNISVLSYENIERKINHLQGLISMHPDMEIVCTDSCECFDGNREYLRRRALEESNRQVRSILEKDREMLSQMQSEMSNARQFYLVIIQSLAQLEKNYGKEGAEILADNCQDTIFGGFAPNSQTAAALSENLGSRTVLSGSVTQGKDNNSQSLQMMERPLMSADELKSMPKGSFVVMKTGTHPMKTKLKLFFEWGIRFEKPLQMEDRGSRPAHYAGKAELEKAILSENPLVFSEETLPAKPNLKAASTPEKTALKT